MTAAVSEILARAKALPMRWRRALAFLVDRGIAISLVFLAVASSESFAQASLPRLGRAALALWMILAVVYAYGRDAFSGSSLGRRIFGLRVVVAGQGTRPSPLACVKRELSLHFFPLVVAEALLVGSERSRLGDRWAGTSIVDAYD